MLALSAQPAVMAAGLSDLVVHSSLGEPLRAEVQLTPSSGEAVEPECFQIAAPATAGADDLPWIRNARIAVSGNRLRITTREPINHPLAMLGLRLGCGLEIQRDYPILLQPPMERKAAPEVSSPTVAMAPPARIPRSAPPRRATHAGAAPAGQYGNRPLPPTAAKHDKITRKTGSKGRHGDRLVISKDRNPPLRLDYRIPQPPLLGEKGPQPAPAGKAALPAYDESITAQLELDEKIKRLEEYQKVLRQRIAELDQQAAVAAQRTSKAPAPSSAAPTVATAPPQSAQPATAPADEAPKAAAPDWLAVLGGIAAVAAGGLALLWMRRKRPEAAPVEDFDALLPDESRFPREAAIQSGATEESTAPHSATQAQASVAAPSLPPPPPYTPPAIPDDSAEWAEPTFAPAHPIPFDETVDEQDSALELAEIMMSFGRTQGAAETLADYIRSNPRQAVKPWLKLLDVYYVAGMRAEFEALTRQLNKTFNVKPITWDDFKAIRSSAADSVEQMPHITHRLQELWGTEEAQAYLHQLLRDNRNGTRQGFPLSVIEELLLLLAVLDDTLGTYRPNLELTLADMEPRPGNKAAA